VTSHFTIMGPQELAWGPAQRRSELSKVSLAIDVSPSPFDGLLDPLLTGLYQPAVRDNYQTPASLLVTPEAGGHGLARTFLRYSPQQ
jgi:hypothetical protein